MMCLVSFLITVKLVLLCCLSLITVVEFNHDGVAAAVLRQGHHQHIDNEMVDDVDETRRRRRMMQTSSSTSSKTTWHEEFYDNNGNLVHIDIDQPVVGVRTVVVTEDITVAAEQEEQGTGTNDVLTLDLNKLASLADSGTYYMFPPNKTFRMVSPWRIHGVRDVIYDGQGSKFVFVDPNNGGGIRLEDCERVSFRNFELSFDNTSFPLFTVAKVVEEEEEYLVNNDGDGDETGLKVVPLDDEDDADMNLNLFVNYSAPIKSISTYAPDNVWGWVAPTGGGPDDTKYREAWFPKDWTISDLTQANLTRFRNRAVLFRHFIYDHFGITVDLSRHAHFSNLTLSSIPGMGIATGTTHHLYLSNITIRRQAGQPASISADGFHASSASDVIMEDCDFSYMGDDSVNVHVKILPLTCHILNDEKHGGDLNDPSNRSSSRGSSVLVSTKDDKNERETKVREWMFWNTLRLVDPSQHQGRIVHLYDEKMQYLGSSNVSNVTFDPHTIELMEDSDSISSSSSSNGCSTDVRYGVMDDTIPRRVLLRNNYFHDHRARGILLQANTARIEDTRIERVTWSAILSAPSVDGWYEGLGLQNVVFSIIHLQQICGATRPYESHSAIHIRPLTTKGGVPQKGFNRNISFVGNNTFVDINCNEYDIEGLID